MDIDSTEFAGFHIIAVQETREYDESIATVRVGVRAVWLLYRRGQWELLRSLKVRPERLARLTYGDDLTYRQERYLLRIPEVVTAAKRLVRRYLQVADEADYQSVRNALLDIVVERRLQQ